MELKQDMTALTALFTRRSVRAFTERPVSGEDLLTIVRAGMHAPSAHNERTWEILSITDRALLNALSGQTKYWRMLAEAPLCIVCATKNPRPEQQPEREELFVHNAIAAVENMLLAAHALGLGAVWLGINARAAHYAPVNRLLQTPGGYRTVAVLAMGHPRGPLAERALPKDRFEPEKWHREAWGAHGA